MSNFCFFLPSSLLFLGLYSDFMGAGRCTLWPFVLVRSILKYRFLWAYVSARCLGSSHPLTRANRPLTSPFQEMTIGCNPLQPLFCSVKPPDYQTCSHAATTCLSAKVMLFLARILSHKLKSFQTPTQMGMCAALQRPPATCGAYSKDWWKQLPYW